MIAPNPPTQMQELQIVDTQGRPRLVLSAASGTPSITLLHSDGTPQAIVSLGETGLPCVELRNPNPAHPTARLEVDDKGTHIKMDHPSGSTTYLYVNNQANCGLAMEDTQRKRRLDAKVPAAGEPSFHLLDDAGNPTA